jgi:osomolarity two-component system sensor histidine kinase SLN1
VLPQSSDGYSPSAQTSIRDSTVGKTLAHKERLFRRIFNDQKERTVHCTDKLHASRRRQFCVPTRVKDYTYFVYNKLTDLITTFNKISNELTMQYESLKEKVRQRTAELELSKEAAEAANESKTLFTANISHKLKTLLNSIIGMCAVCMSENDALKLKQSLKVIYKSRELLLNLLTDLLTFR